MDYAPPITITPPITRLCVEAGTLVGSLEERVPPRDLALAREIHEAQLRELIEASELESEGATALSEVVKAACQRLESYDPTSLSDLVRLNTFLADSLGSFDVWRTKDERDGGSDDETPAPAARVSHLLEGLLDWYAMTDLHPLVASSVFRFEYDYIQPFSRASHFTGVLWHRLMLARWNPVLRWCELEQVLREREAERGEALSESRKRINDAPYVTFMLESLVETLTRLGERLDRGISPAGKSERVLAFFAEQPKATIAEASDALGMAPRTCARYISELQRAGKLTRVGSRRSGYWHVG